MGFLIGDWEHALDVYLTTPPEEPESQCKCCVCGEELYPEDTYYDFEGDIYCENCAEWWINRHKFAVREDMCYPERS